MDIDREIKNVTLSGIYGIFHPVMDHFMVGKFREFYGDGWWESEVRQSLSENLVKSLPENLTSNNDLFKVIREGYIAKFDIIHISVLISRYWSFIFRDTFRNEEAKDFLQVIVKARNKASHTEPIEIELARRGLWNCMTLLGYIDEEAREQIKPLLKELRRLDDLDENAGRSRIVNLPSFTTDNFFGRHTYLDTLRSLLLDDSVHTIAAVGEGGIGKTDFVLACAHQNSESFTDAVVYCDAENKDARSVVQYLVACLEPGANVPITTQPWDAWNRYVSKKSALIIIDNADSLESEAVFRPVGEKCKTILTVHSSAYAELLGLSSGSIIDLPELEQDEALLMMQHLITRRLEMDDLLALDELLDKIGGLPLAIEMAAFYLNQNPDLAVRDYSGSLDSLSYLKKGVRQVFQKSLSRLPAKTQDYFAALGVCAHGTFNLEVASALGKRLGIDPRVELTILTNYKLLQRAENNRFKFQRLLQEYSRELASERDLLSTSYEAYSVWHEEFVKSNSVYEGDVSETNRAAHMPMLENEIEGIFTTAEGRLGSPGINLSAWRDYWRCIRKFIESRGYYDRAIDLLEVTYEIAKNNNEQSKSQDNQELVALEAYFAAQLGKFYRLAGRSAEASQLFKHADEIEVDEERRKHIRTSQSRILGMQHNFREAIEILKNDLEKNAEADFQSRVFSLNALGRAEMGAGNRQEALKHLQEALEIEQANHLSCNVTLSEMGRAYKKLNQYQEALDCFEKAAMAASQVNDLRNLSILSNEAGEVLGLLERYPESIEKHLLGMQLNKKVADPRSRIIARKRLLKSLSPTIKKARLLKKEKNWQEALPYMVAWANGEREMGEANFLFWALVEQGDVLIQLTRYEEALARYDEAKSIAGENKNTHSISIACQCRARVYEKMGSAQYLTLALKELETAEKYEQQPGTNKTEMGRIKDFKGRVSHKLENLKQEVLLELTTAELLEYASESRDVEKLSDLLVSKARIWFETGNRNLAGRTIESALAYKPDSQPAQELAALIFSTNQGHRNLAVGSKGQVVKIINKETEKRYFGFIQINQPRDVHFTPLSLEVSWNDIQEKDFVVVDWFVLPDGKYSANRVVIVDSGQPGGQKKSDATK
jgi:tetratricopeptide (TPR) repeat protein